MQPLVSVIIPTYNRAEYLVRALASVARQDYRPIEVVVVDDGSTDDTPQVLREQKQTLAAGGVELITHFQKNQRAPKARNVGMKLATGSIYAFLDSDDLWFDGFAATLVNLLERYPSAGLAFSGIVVIDPDDRVQFHRSARLPAEPQEGSLARPFESILRYMPLQTSGVMVRRSVVEDVGDFDLDLPVVEDWDLWYRISRKYDFAYTLKGLAANRLHTSNLPKYDTVCIRGNLKMDIKFLRDVQDPELRQTLIKRIGWFTQLFQEQIMREGRTFDGDLPLLENEYAPRSTRYRFGRMMRQAPRPMRKVYAGLVRLVGNLTHPGRGNMP